MANCKKCGKPVVTAPVYCPECQEKTGGWISVKDRLPEEEKRVLVYDSRVNDFFTALLFRSQGELCWDAIFVVTIEGTYWMPLPEPPGEEG